MSQPARRRKPASRPRPQPASATVTYRGPKDPDDPGTRFVAAGDSAWRFPIGVPVPDVPKAIVAELQDAAVAERHAFEFTPKEG